MRRTSTPAAFFLNIFLRRFPPSALSGFRWELTSRLDTAGKILITLTMFVGRVGILTLVYLFAQQKAPPRYEYAEENIMIG